MFTVVSVQVPTDTLLKLLGHLKEQGGKRDVSQAMSLALCEWLARQTGAPPEEPLMRGYQWKSLFLPEGTCLRSWSYGQPNYARVVGDQIIHDGRAVSPNQFARSFARTNRNAWDDLLVKRPQDKGWKKASILRKELAATPAAAGRPAGQAARRRGTVPGRAAHGRTASRSRKRRLEPARTAQIPLPARRCRVRIGAPLLSQPSASWEPSTRV
ncbi:hypothetical protein [Pseudoduganella namucuonensis]|uniref:Uncharacterized protein n=1 Tax=Pseudoduganella namucuonensis TaxID=1035707 RepID=A0A1I7L4B7_9BURK|nr:hypothetical protein [Pseudoduganella namucuonensis]SFV04592.1 hypothetical protein SAMN05216552_102312 [Pseudoduganella namucuonensis]